MKSFNLNDYNNIIDLYLDIESYNNNAIINKEKVNIEIIINVFIKFTITDLTIFMICYDFNHFKKMFGLYL